MDRQVTYIIENRNDLIHPAILKEVGSGLNDKRPKLLKLIEMIEADEISRIFITYKDRLTRFGFNYINTICKAHDVEIVVIKDLDKIKSIEEELSEDLMALIASFSGRLYGMRSHSNKTRKEN